MGCVSSPLKALVHPYLPFILVHPPAVALSLLLKCSPLAGICQQSGEVFLLQEPTGEVLPILSLLLPLSLGLDALLSNIQLLALGCNQLFIVCS